jgi:hypothetical protein
VRPAVGQPGPRAPARDRDHEPCSGGRHDGHHGLRGRLQMTGHAHRATLGAETDRQGTGRPSDATRQRVRRGVEAPEGSSSFAS